MSQRYIATEPLFYQGVRAHNVGDVVPDENVERNGWKDSVSREGSKAADEALKVAAGESEAAVPVSAQSPAPK